MESQGTLRQATLCFLIKDNKILLAMKKRGFGMGKLNGVGGKKDANETIEEAAKREAFEEIGVSINKMHRVATIDFYFPSDKKLELQVSVFFADSWEGEPLESEEMAPQWFDIDKIPYDKMWVDDIKWLPVVLEGKKIEACFILSDNDTIQTYFIDVLKSKD